MVAAVVASLALTACGDDGPPPAPRAGCREAAPEGSVTLVALDLAWDTGCLAWPADTEVTITIDNRDDQVNHNLHLLGLPNGSPKTDLEPGPVVQHLDVQAPAGSYAFVCDIHPTMTGDVQVG